MSGNEWLVERFEAGRARLRAVAYRILGSVGEADDAIQETWLRVSRAETSEVENLEGWFTAILARVSLNMLRSRKSRREESLGLSAAEPPAAEHKQGHPEDETLLAESVGLALLVVLDRLAPAERVAFVLHDVLGLSFDDIAPILGRSLVAARQLASRARRRVRGTGRRSGVALSQQRKTVEAFLAALRAGDIDGVLSVLNSHVVRRADRVAVISEEARELRGARSVAEEALKYKDLARSARPILVNGSAGIVVAPGGRLRTVISCTVKRGKIIKVEVIAEPARLNKLNLTVPPD